MKPEQQIAVNTERLNKLEQRAEWLEDHYSTFNEEMGEVKSDIKWIAKMLWWELGIMISGFASIFSVILYHIYASK